MFDGYYGDSAAGSNWSFFSLHFGE